GAPGRAPCNRGHLDRAAPPPSRRRTEAPRAALLELTEGGGLGAPKGNDRPDPLTDPAIVGRQRARLERRDEYDAGLDRRACERSDRHQRGQDPEDHRGPQLTHRSAPFQHLDAIAWE